MMNLESEIDRILAAYAAKLNTEFRRYHGRETGLRDSLGPETDPEQGKRTRQALDQALRSGLLRHSQRDWEHILLTPEGWDRVPGGMPGQEKDGPFLRTALALWSDPTVKRWKGRLLGSTIYRALDWPFDGCEAGNIARRLAARRLVDQVEMEGDVRVRPTGAALSGLDVPPGSPNGVPQ